MTPQTNRHPHEKWCTEHTVNKSYNFRTTEREGMGGNLVEEEFRKLRR